LIAASIKPMIVHEMSEESITKPPTRRRVILVRHGEVSYFDERGRPVRPDIVPLNDEGRAQAATAAQALAPLSIDRAISSGLPRSDETARIIVAGRGISVEARPELREIRPGRLADIPTDSIEQAFVGAFGNRLDREAKFLGGESFGVFVDRVLGCWIELTADQSTQSLLIVAHGGVNRALLCHALGLGLSGFGMIEQDAGCINIMDGDPTSGYIIRLLNYTPYNPAKVGLNLTTMERLYHDYQSRLAKKQIESDFRGAGGRP
jgi:probable phosphoglycerate mutase